MLRIPSIFVSAGITVVESSNDTEEAAGPAGAQGLVYEYEAPAPAPTRTAAAAAAADDDVSVDDLAAQLKALQSS